jgi:hypothetical protein
MSKKSQTTGEVVKSILSSEVKFVIAVIGFVVGVITPFYQTKQDVALIQKDVSIINTNHLAHMQDLSQKMSDITTIIQSQQKEINNLQTQQAVILEKITK